MTANQLYPAYPVKYVEPSQIAGLALGELHCQPLWRGRRSILSPDGTFWSPRGNKPLSVKLSDRHRRLYLVGLPLDVTLTGGGAMRVNDVVMAAPLLDRIELAEARGIHIDAVRVTSHADVDAELLKWSAYAGCVGVVLKRESVPYPWCPRGSRKLADWISVDRPLTRARAR